MVDSMVNMIFRKAATAEGLPSLNISNVKTFPHTAYYIKLSLEFHSVWY